jgi:hypothetical protein
MVVQVVALILNVILQDLLYVVVVHVLAQALCTGIQLLVQINAVSII